MRNLRRWLFILAAGGAAGVSCPAETIKSVTVKSLGGQQPDTTMVLSYCSAKEGVDFDRADIANDVRRLLASGRFSDVVVKADRVTGGIAIVFEVRPKLKLVSPVKVVGAEEFSESKVRELLGFSPGDFIDDPSVAARVAKLKEEYRKERYAFASVTWSLVVADPKAGQATLVVKVKEGDRTSVHTVSFPGRKAVEYSALRDAMDLPAWWNPLWWFREVPYDTGELNAGCERVRALYRDQGYLDVQVKDPIVSETRPGVFEISIPVVEGICYRLAGTSVAGVTLFPEQELIRVANLRPGNLASWSLIQKGADAIRDYYEQRGYMNTIVQPRLDMSGKGGDVDVRYAVTEGRLGWIHDVIIRGNRVTHDKVIRRELLVYPNEQYDGVRVRRSEQRLRNLGFFSSVYSYEEPVGRTNENNIVFEVEEQPTGQFLAGAGFSSIDKLVGFVEVSQGNFDLTGWPFVGGGQKIKVRAEGGTRSESYTLSFVEPWFMDRRLSLGFDFYSMRRSDTDYDTKRLGGDIKLGVPLPGAARLDLTYRLEQVDILDVSDTNEYVFADASGTKPFAFAEPKRTESSLSATVSRDTRDDWRIPTRGSRMYATATVMGGPFGLDTDLYDLEAGGAVHFSPWAGHVVSLRGLTEVIDGYGDTETVPLSERLFMGGARTVRGFRYRWVGPKAERADGTDILKPCGGQTKALATLEYSIPLYSRFRLAGFCDAGNVWFDAYDYDLSSIAVGAGVGIRVDFPQFPIRFDYAWPVEKDDPRSKTEHWSFWIGYGF